MHANLQKSLLLPAIDYNDYNVLWFCVISSLTTFYHTPYVLFDLPIPTEIIHFSSNSIFFPEYQKREILIQEQSINSAQLLSLTSNQQGIKYLILCNKI